MEKTKGKLTPKAFKEHIKPITNNPFNAVIELIANAYDAGANNLWITWPIKNNLDDSVTSSEAIFRDDGHGMSKIDFDKIWNQLSYNRIENQGQYVDINFEGEIIKRQVYGRNGKGRHSPFAFTNKYKIKTVKNNELSLFEVKINDESFIIEHIKTIETDEDNGTEITFNVNYDKILSAEEIKETIATRFLKDDSFTIYLNDDKINLADVDEDNILEFTCDVDGTKVTIIQLESSNRSIYKKFHGLSWRIGIRLIEDKTWDDLLDGRRRISKKFNFIIYADILKDYVNETMTGFINDDYVDHVKKIVYDTIKKSLNNYLKEVNNKNKRLILEDNLPDIKKLSLIGKEEIGTFITEVQENCPSINFNDLKATTEIFIKLQKSKSGYGLLHKLSELSSSDYDELNEVLKEWDVHSAKIVLDEIKWRLDIIKELRLKMDDPNTDEVHELQPIFEKGLWIFGPEFEAIEYTSNESLSNVIRKIFKKDNIDVENPLSRPDFVVLPEDGRSVSLYSTPSFNEDNETDDVGKLLIIELKKGGFKITSNEVHQTQWYIEQLIDGGFLSDKAQIQAFVLGIKVKAREMKLGDNDNIRIIPKQYHVILNKAENRLFNLEKTIRESKNIDYGTGDEVMDDVLKQDVVM